MDATGYAVVVESDGSRWWRYHHVEALTPEGSAVAHMIFFSQTVTGMNAVGEAFPTKFVACAICNIWALQPEMTL